MYDSQTAHEPVSTILVHGMFVNILHRVKCKSLHHSSRSIIRVRPSKITASSRTQDKKQQCDTISYCRYILFFIYLLEQVNYHTRVIVR